MIRLTEVDDLLRPQHAYLRSGDRCFFLREYSARMGYQYSDTNQLILNFKKRPSRAGLPDWPYKAKAISQIARELHSSLSNEWMRQAIFIPMPPSKQVGDPEYDDRVVQVLREMKRLEPGLRYQEALQVLVSSEAAHSVQDRPAVDDLVRLLRVSVPADGNPPRYITIVDDVLTTGAHYVAATRVLAAAYPDALFSGLFVARRRVPDE